MGRLVVSGLRPGLEQAVHLRQVRTLASRPESREPSALFILTPYLQSLQGNDAQGTGLAMRAWAARLRVLSRQGVVLPGGANSCASSMTSRFGRPDLTAFSRLDGLGLEAVGQRLEPGPASRTSAR